MTSNHPSDEDFLEECFEEIKKALEGVFSSKATIVVSFFKADPGRFLFGVDFGSENIDAEAYRWLRAIAIESIPSGFFPAYPEGFEIKTSQGIFVAQTSNIKWDQSIDLYTLYDELYGEIHLKEKEKFVPWEVDRPKGSSRFSELDVVQDWFEGARDPLEPVIEGFIHFWPDPTFKGSKNLERRRWAREWEAKKKALNDYDSNFGRSKMLEELCELYKKKKLEGIALEASFL